MIRSLIATRKRNASTVPQQPAELLTLSPAAYTTSQPGYISAGVYRPDGSLAKGVSYNEAKAASTHALGWDGTELIHNGTTWVSQAVADTTGYTFRVDHASAKITIEVESLMDGMYPQGDNLHWQTGLANDTGAYSVVAEHTNDRLHVGGLIGEQVRTQLITNKAITSHIASGWQPDVSVGFGARCVVNDKVLGLTGRGEVGVLNLTQMNGKDQNVGPRLSPEAPGSNYVGDRWSAYYSGASPAIPAFNQNSAGAIGRTLLANIDLAGYQVGGVNHCVLSYRLQNRVRWVNYLTGVEEDFNTVTEPLGVEIALNGDVLCISEGRVVKFTKAAKTLVELIPASALSSPWRMSVDRSNGDIFVAERNDASRVVSNQVKKFSSAGTLLATYGSAGGRQSGLYVATNFCRITDIAADHAGGFYVCESEKGYLPRLARFNAAGTLLKECYGGFSWTAFAAPEPTDKGAIWLSLKDGVLVRMLYNFTTKIWLCHSHYNLNELAETRITSNSLGAGLDVYKPMMLNGALHLCSDLQSGGWQVLKPDNLAGTLKAVVKAQIGNYQGNFDKAAMWTDKDNSGVFNDVDEPTGERRRFDHLIYNRNHRVQNDGMQLYDAYNSGIIKRSRITSYNAAGAPVYEAPTNLINLPSWLKRSGETNIYGGTHFTASKGEGHPIFMVCGTRNAAGQDIGPFGRGEHVHIIKYDAAGNYVMRFGRNVSGYSYYTYKVIQPGEFWSCPKNVLVIGDYVIVPDFNGGNNSRTDWTAFVDVWTVTGLYVGALFGEPNLSLISSSVPKTAYCLSSENGAMSVFLEGNTLWIYGSQESGIRLYKATLPTVTSKTRLLA